MIPHLWMKDMIYFFNEKNNQDIYLQLFLKQMHKFHVYRKFTLFLFLLTKVIKKKVNYWSSWREHGPSLSGGLSCTLTRTAMVCQQDDYFQGDGIHTWVVWYSSFRKPELIHLFTGVLLWLWANRHGSIILGQMCRVGIQQFVESNFPF